MLLGILQADPAQVFAFLDDAGAALGHVNSVLKVPARNDREFRDKIDQLFREIHRTKGEAATLGLSAVETRAHDFEDALHELRQRTSLSGDDFLPMVVRLDELFSHLKSLRELVVRLDGLRAHAVLESPATATPLLSEAAFDKLAQRLAADHGKNVRLTAAGLEHVPAEYTRPVRDIAIQLVRNAVVHGIEPASARREAGKSATGTIHLAFRPAPGGFELLFEDDGAGVDERRVRAEAIARGLVGAEQGEALDARSVLALLFKAGFSTRDRQDRDAGRGVGLDLVRRTVQSLSGKLGVTSVSGKFTRFRLTLPAPEAVRQQAVG
jgi:chemotaxis protein histidine kinase CheA